VKASTIEDTLEEYASMIDDALESGQTIESFIERMGSAKKVAKAFAKERKKRSNRLVAIMPFLSTIIFFLLGVFYNAWHPGWLVFLLIPVSGILTNKPIRWRGLMVFIILTTFILIVYQTNLVNPFWSLFILLIPRFNSAKNQFIHRLAFVYTYLAVIVYCVIVLYLLFGFIGATQNLRDVYSLFSLLVFVPVAIYVIWSGRIEFKIDGVDIDWRDLKSAKPALFHLVFLLTVLVSYIIIGFASGLWHPGWLIFFIIPIFYIVRKAKKFPLVPLMPFIATTLFILVGEYVNIPGQTSGYVLSWLFFFLIPISGILQKGGE
jgi:hypothetical protein